MLLLKLISRDIGSLSSDWDAESKCAGVASLAALVSVIAQLIDKASK
jgi:hypothetical protein